MFPAAVTSERSGRRRPALFERERSSGVDGGMAESIYNLLPRIKEETVKPPMYKATFDHSRKVPYSTFDQRKAKGGMFGIKEGNRSMEPRHFLRVGEGTEARRRAGKRPDLPKIVHGLGGSGGGAAARSGSPAGWASRGPTGMKRGLQLLPARMKPPVPRRGERPTMGLHSTKNFVTSNAVETILAVPANRHRPPIDYLKKEDFGRVPDYLAQVQAEVRAENEMVEEFVREQMGISAIAKEEIPEMPSEEQAELVDKLKAKWDDVNCRYQLLVHQTFFDNGRLVAKARLEKELDEIEADIAKLTKGPVVVVP
ncbi:unnamed protein product [Ectocarpus sp. 12 AP-2014]